MRHAAPEIDPARPAAAWRWSEAGRAAAHAGSRVAIVSHGTVIALYLGMVSGADPVAIWRGLAMPDVRQLPH